jgi:hypothetical protein
MISNQDTEGKEHPIPMTGIEVMQDLEIDAIKLLYLGSQKILLPISPKEPIWLSLFMNSRTDPPEVSLSRCIYQKPDVEDFKLKHKELWEGLKKQKRDALDTPKQAEPISPESETNRGDKKKDERFGGDNVPSTTDYIKRRGIEGASIDLIAYELHDPKGQFKLSHLNVAKELGLNEGLNEKQFAAIKQRGKRACDKGKSFLKKNKIVAV